MGKQELTGILLQGLRRPPGPTLKAKATGRGPVWEGSRGGGRLDALLGELSLASAGGAGEDTGAGQGEGVESVFLPRVAPPPWCPSPSPWPESRREAPLPPLP